ncbi:MAG: endolytic transglycosylase MltG [Methylophilaceae bacterium]|nr:endolytic transglycosylase MltG [Methylophilaceae bacterium]
MRLLLKLGILLGALVSLAAAWLWHFAHTPVLSEASASVTFSVKAGSTLRTVSRQLVEAGILEEPWSFSIMARLMGRASDLKAGNYLLEPGLTPYRLLKMLTNGDVAQLGITFIEGWTFRQFREALNRHEHIQHLSMQLSDEEILRRIGASERHPEGLFFPDTYYFSSNLSDLDILQRAYRAMQQKLEQAWKTRAPGLPYSTPYQALIMASIIEKETGKPEERRRIAGVFVNRLKRGMRLQTDPTVIYGLGSNFDGNLRKRDLLTDNPYNTYTRSGLPPTPIAMPGLGAIEAALNPDVESGYLYFVGKGDGSHVFSRTLTEHNRAVARYQLKRY